MVYIVQFILSFFASLGFGILFNAPRKMLMACGLTGAIGWVTYFILEENVGDSLIAVYVATIVLTLIAYVLARKLRTPVLSLIVCGIIPLVPGGTAYEAMRQVVLKEYNSAIAFGFEAMIIAGAIAMGIISAEMIDSSIQAIRARRRAK